MSLRGNSKFFIFELLFLNLIFLLHADCFIGTGIDAYAAVDAGVRVHLCLSVNHRNGFARALFHTRFATGALCLIYLCRHLHNPFQKNRTNTNKITTHPALPWAAPGQARRTKCYKITNIIQHKFFICSPENKFVFIPPPDSSYITEMVC